MARRTPLRQHHRSLSDWEVFGGRYFIDMLIYWLLIPIHRPSLLSKSIHVHSIHLWFSHSVLKMSCNSVNCRIFMLISAKYCDESVQSSLYIGNIDFWCGLGPLYPHCWMSRCLASSAAPLTSLRGPVTEPRPLYLQICHRPVLRPDVLQHYISDYILHL